MKKYVVKINQFDLETGETNLFFIGKDGYVHGDSEYAVGWKLKRFAEEYIQRDMKGNYWKRGFSLYPNNVIENEKWISHYSIIEVEQEND